MEIKTKFNKGGKIAFMHNNKPEFKEILGISIHLGKIDESCCKQDDGFTITYHTGFYESVQEGNCYDSLEDLQKALFNTKQDEN